MSYFCLRIFVAVLLLAFMLQSTAAPVSCGTNDAVKITDTHQNMMKHDMQSGAKMLHHKRSEKPDCCDYDCSCPAGICASLIVITNNVIQLAPLVKDHKTNQCPDSTLQPDITSLFRPPIFS
tara:strand:+ start:4112 stop:4477 length:366 start_codon:yes stop_codon:yes gene_type:complete